MHLQVTLIIVLGRVLLSAGLPQYQPLSSLQQYYKGPLPVYSTTLDAPRAVQGQKPMYTYAEVNTPYYQYHYYSPVYKNYQPTLLQGSSIKPPSVRNEVNPHASTTLKQMFYPATTTIPLSNPQSGFRNNGYFTGHEPSIQSISPPFGNKQEVAITSKPLTVNNVFAPVVRTYHPPISNELHPFPVTHVSTPTELASGFPNIFRETYGNDRDPETLLTYQSTTFKPDLIVTAKTNPDLSFKPIIVPESLATPSSTIVKDEVRRRGISPQVMDQDQQSSPTKKSALETSFLNRDTFTSTSTPQFSTPVKKSSEPSKSDVLNSGISETILRVFSSPNLQFPQSYEFNTSVVIPTDVESNSVSREDTSTSLDSVTQSTPHVSPQIATETTTSHRQKIAKKVHPTVVPKKFFVKQPNVLFYSPGHDIPN